MVQGLFRYNWQRRAAWFDWCEAVGDEVLQAPRIGGQRGMLRTMFHIVVVEYSWIRDIQGEPAFDDPFERYADLAAVRGLDAALHSCVADYLDGVDEAEWRRLFPAPWDAARSLQVGGALEHVVAHEIHHAGQLSVWSREIGREPVSANGV